MQNGIYKNHFFDYEDTNAKHRTCRDDISTGLAPLRCVHGPRTWHKTDESTIDLAKRQGLGPRISYKVTVILYKPLLTKSYKFNFELLFSQEHLANTSTTEVGTKYTDKIPTGK